MVPKVYSASKTVIGLYLITNLAYSHVVLSHDLHYKLKHESVRPVQHKIKITDMAPCDKPNTI